MVALVCQECRISSSAHAAGWRGYRVDDPDKNESPKIAFYCPSCAEQEFGPFGHAVEDNHHTASGE